MSVVGEKVAKKLKKKVLKDDDGMFEKLDEWCRKGCDADAAKYDKEGFIEYTQHGFCCSKAKVLQFDVTKDLASMASSGKDWKKRVDKKCRTAPEKLRKRMGLPCKGKDRMCQTCTKSNCTDDEQAKNYNASPAHQTCAFFADYCA